MDVQKELDGVLRWIAALLILLLQWLYPRVPVTCPFQNVPWLPDLVT